MTPVLNRKKCRSTEEMKRKALALIDATVEGGMPEDLIVFLDARVMNQVMTPRRLELLRLIDSMKPGSVNSLASLAGRLKQAVVRDLKSLEKHEFVTLKKEGKTVRPLIRRRFILLSLTESRRQESRHAAQAVAF